MAWSKPRHLERLPVCLMEPTVSESVNLAQRLCPGAHWMRRRVLGGGTGWVVAGAAAPGEAAGLRDQGAGCEGWVYGLGIRVWELGFGV